MQQISYYNISSEKYRDFYALKLFFTFLILLGILAYTSFYLIQNYYSKSFFDFKEKKVIYFLQSDTLKNMYKKNRMDYDIYLQRIAYFKKLSKENNYDVKDIPANKLTTIDSSCKIIALDMMSLSHEEITQITNYIKKGGKIIFNFTSGFLDESLKYQPNNLVSSITGLKLNKDINTIKLDRNSSVYLSTRLLSPLTKYLPQGYAINLALYDPLPIFDVNSKTIQADGYLTNWSQVNYVKVDKNKELDAQQSALIWHGYLENGKWVYFTFPSYSFSEIDPKLYAKLFKGMLDYLDEDINITPYPYIDSKNVIFVSEDTEYKFENLKQFYDVSQKHNFPVTAFCVAQLAKQHSKLMQQVSKSPLLEIGSHSYTHKKIVQQSDEVYTKEIVGSNKLLHLLTGKKITGFRAPREEIDEKMIKLLENNGYNYILNESDNRLSAHFNDRILIIPRHATDDYTYLINLDWSSDKILQNIIKEANIVVKLDGMYTLSTHTHLMTFSSNIKILDKFFAYVNKQTNMTPMNGQMIYKRISQKKDMHISYKITNKKVILSIFNSGIKSIKNIHYEIDINPNISITGVESEIIGLKSELKKLSSSKYLLVIKSMNPKSKTVLFLNYEKNN